MTFIIHVKLKVCWCHSWEVHQDFGGFFIWRMEQKRGKQLNRWLDKPLHAGWVLLYSHFQNTTISGSEILDSKVMTSRDWRSMKQMNIKVCSCNFCFIQILQNSGKNNLPCMMCLFCLPTDPQRSSPCIGKKDDSGRTSSCHEKPCHSQRHGDLSLTMRICVPKMFNFDVHLVILDDFEVVVPNVVQTFMSLKQSAHPAFENGLCSHFSRIILLAYICSV